MEKALRTPVDDPHSEDDNSERGLESKRKEKKKIGEEESWSRW